MTNSIAENTGQNDPRHGHQAPIIQGKTGPWEVVIGIEIHAQISSKSKLFSGASARFGGDPNSQVTLVDAAMPGMLPVINRYCVEQAIKTGLGLNATIANESVFDRKNYFYADLPQGYQISQFYRPIVEHGYVDILVEDSHDAYEPYECRVRVNRLHLEQDAGKSIHDQSPTDSYIDLNRSGVALMEIVSEPDIRSAAEAAAYVKKIRSLVRYLGTCDGNMEQGSLRADINISIRRPGGEFGTRAEVKNVNSIKFIQDAILYEVDRQIGILESGGEVDQETRLFDASTGETRAMRSKEYAHDYRYFPDPDLLPLRVNDNEIDAIRSVMPELPDAKLQRYVDMLGIKKDDALILTNDRLVADYYESLLNALDISGPKSAQTAANFMISNLFAALNKDGLHIKNSKMSAKQLAGLLKLVQKGDISGKVAKEVFEDMWQTGKEASDIVSEKGLGQISDTDALEAMIDEVIQESPKQVEQYLGGKDKLFGFFIGQIMKKTKGQANPGMVSGLMKKKLESLR